MGLSSNARLLSITARLTSNEYESQQVSNAKMRLAVKSQEASEDYLAALSSTDYAFMTFDSEGNALNVPLTAAVLYQYNASKNQYMLSNIAGQALVNPEDAYNYKNSANLKQFLECYGLKANFRNEDLAKYWDGMKDNQEGYDAFKQAMETYMAVADNKTAWQAEYTTNKTNYETALSNYNKIVDAVMSEPDSITIKDIEEKRDENYNITKLSPKSSEETIYKSGFEDLIKRYVDILAFAKTEYAKTVTFEAYAEDKIKNKDENKGNYTKYKDFKDNLKNYNIELEELGISEDEAYSYDDPTKAQWYTNLWYRMNGNSSEKNTQNQNYQVLENSLLTSTSWIKDALAHGVISIEMASYNASEGNKSIIDSSNPTIKTLQGISWNTKMFSSCPDITRRDDSKAVEQAEAAYKKALTEINIKDERYQRKLTTLDSEHNALQTEYESVKSALSKNIERSFKAFQG